MVNVGNLSCVDPLGVILVTIVTSSNVLNEDYLYIMFELSLKNSKQNAKRFKTVACPV